jgi:hypothetical protein
MGKSRRVAPSPAESAKKLVVYPVDFGEFPKAGRIVRTRLKESLRRTKIDAKNVENPRQERTAAAVHSQYAHYLGHRLRLHLEMVSFKPRLGAYSCNIRETSTSSRGTSLSSREGAKRFPPYRTHRGIDQYLRIEVEYTQAWRVWETANSTSRNDADAPGPFRTAWP